MSRPTRRTAVSGLGAGEDGLALVVVVLVSLVLMGMLVLTLASQNHADTSSARDRNFDLALAVAEAGAHQAIAKIDSSQGTFAGTFSGTTPQGSYTVTVSRSSGRYVIESRGRVGGSQLGRTRVVRLTLEPPPSFTYALFSETSIDLKNLDVVEGDVWANDSVKLEANDEVKGSVTAARGWVDLDANSVVRKDVWSGGFNVSGPWAIRLANGARVEGNAKASVSAPNDPTTCGGEDPANYGVPLGSGAQVVGNLTTWGEKSGPGTVGSYSPHVCTEAAIPASLPPFSYNPNNYDRATLHEFGSVAEFQSWLAQPGNLTNLRGTFYVAEPAPSQQNRIDLSGAAITGDTTIVSDAPIFTNGVTDPGAGERTFVVVSRYKPPTGSACDVNHDRSECAIHLKNDFQPSCQTAVLVYADRGPVAVKNNAKLCGTIYAESILVKNNQTLVYDARVQRVVGFGTVTYGLRRWEERRAR